MGGNPFFPTNCTLPFELFSPLAPANGGGAPARGVGGLAPLHHNPVERKEREREREREKESLAQNQSQPPEQATLLFTWREDQTNLQLYSTGGAPPLTYPPVLPVRPFLAIIYQAMPSGIWLAGAIRQRSTSPPPPPAHTGATIVATKDDPTQESVGGYYLGMGVSLFMSAVGPLRHGQPFAWHIRVHEAPVVHSRGAIRFSKGDQAIIIWREGKWKWELYSLNRLHELGGYVGGAGTQHPTRPTATTDNTPLDPSAALPPQQGDPQQTPTQQPQSQPQPQPQTPAQQANSPARFKAPPPQVMAAAAAAAAQGDESQTSWPSQDKEPDRTDLMQRRLTTRHPTQTEQEARAAVARARRCLLRIVEMTRGEALLQAQQALAALQPPTEAGTPQVTEGTSQSSRDTYHGSPRPPGAHGQPVPPNPHATAHELLQLMVAMIAAIEDMHQKVSKEDLLQDLEQVLQLLQEGARLFAGALRARDWGAVHQGEEYAERAQEICENLLAELRRDERHPSYAMDAIERLLYLTQEAAELHQTAWGAHNEEENDLDTAEAYRPLRKRPRHPADVL